MAELPMIISVDDHIVEPATTWTDRIPTKYHDVCPRIVRAPMGEITFVGGKLTVKPGSEGNPTDWWHYEDLKRPLLRVDSAVGVPRDEVTMKGITYADMRPGSYRQKERLEDMDEKGARFASKMTTLELIGLFLPFLSVPTLLARRNIVLSVDNVSVGCG